MTAADLVRLWPAAGVRARAGNLELRWIDDELLVDLADLAARGVHDPDRMPFAVPWSRGTPDEIARSVLSFQWNARSQVGADRFALELAALVDGRVVGVQGTSATDWRTLRRAATGSWLGSKHQGRGIGTRMRALMLELLFDGLGASEVTSGAFADNPASSAVSRKLGYEHNGNTAFARDGRAVEHHNYRLLRGRWLEMRESHRQLLGAPIELEGVERLRAVID